MSSELTGHKRRAERNFGASFFAVSVEIDKVEKIFRCRGSQDELNGVEDGELDRNFGEGTSKRRHGTEQKLWKRVWQQREHGGGLELSVQVPNDDRLAAE